MMHDGPVAEPAGSRAARAAAKVSDVQAGPRSDRSPTYAVRAGRARGALAALTPSSTSAMRPRQRKSSMRGELARARRDRGSIFDGRPDPAGSPCIIASTWPPEAPQAPQASRGGAGSVGVLLVVVVLVGLRARPRPPPSGCSPSCRARYPPVSALETHRAEPGHQGLRRQRRAHHRVPRRAPHLRAPHPDPARRSARPILATEDARFYSHFGVDPMGIARAVYQNFRRGRIVEGGSTITQQLAKVLFLTPDKSLERKLKEAVLALELERRYSKDRILEMYLNHIYFGHGAFGVEAAARTYFGKGVNELSLCRVRAPRRPAQGADHLLAVRAPGGREAAPRHRARAHGGRRRAHAGRGQEGGRDARWASCRRSAGAPPASTTSSTSSSTLEQQYGADIVFKGGLQVYTTLSPGCSSRPSSSCARACARSRRGGSRPRTADTDRARGARRPEGALLSHRAPDRLHQGDGGWLRLLQERVQPRGAGAPAARLGVQALRLHRRARGGLHPGERGRRLPRRVPGRPATASPGSPTTTTASSAGSITLQQALEESVNVAAVKVQERVGIRRTIDVARRLGVESPLHENLSLALGTSDMTLLEITSAYGALANQGTWMRPEGDPLRAGRPGQAARGEHAGGPAGALARAGLRRHPHAAQGTIERGTGAAAKALGRPAAAKTGTTNDYSNAWFIGYTPAARHRRLGRLRPPAEPGPGRDGLAGRGADLDRFHVRGAGRDAEEEFPVPERVVLVADRPGPGRRRAPGRWSWPSSRARSRRRAAGPAACRRSPWRRRPRRRPRRPPCPRRRRHRRPVPRPARQRRRRPPPSRSRPPPRPGPRPSLLPPPHKEGCRPLPP